MAVDNVAASNVDVSNLATQDKVFAKLTRWGIPRDGTLAVAFSGGGDSTALLDLLLKWCENGHVFAFIVDHALRENSDKEAKLAQGRAQAMGAQTKILTCQWPNGTPTTGIQEKARNARYQLLGEACRDLGVDMLMLGHNQDDQAETVLMRQDAGSGWRGLAGMRAYSLAPIWPALCGVIIVRPMLSCSRDELRTYSRKIGLKWIEDPSNENRSFARIRAREYLATHENEKQNLLLTSKAASETLALEKAKIAYFIKDNTELHAWGGMTLLPGFHSAKLGQGAEALKYLLPAISGQALPPASDKRMNLARRLRSPDFSGATLGGVRFVPMKGGILCVRELGALKGRSGVNAHPKLKLFPDAVNIWDGRFAVTGSVEALSGDIYVDAFDDWEVILDEPYKGAYNILNTLPVFARQVLPVMIKNNFVVHISILDIPLKMQGIQVRSLLGEHLHALLSE